MVLPPMLAMQDDVRERLETLFTWLVDPCIAFLRKVRRHALMRESRLNLQSPDNPGWPAY